MTKQTKITATEARFPLASLTLSTINPRQVVPQDDVIELDMSVEAAAKLVISAGLVAPEFKEATEKALEKRSKKND